MPQPKRQQLKWKHTESDYIGAVFEELLVKFEDRLLDRGADAAFRAKFSKLRADSLAAHTGKFGSNTTQYTSTAQVNALLKLVRATTSGIRANIRRRFPHRKDLHKAFGVGEADKSGTTKGALFLIESIQKAVTEYPVEVAAARIIQRDINSLEELHRNLLAAETKQGKSIGANIISTAARDSIHREFIEMIDEVLGMAMMEFANEPEILALFTHPVPTRRTKPKQVA